MLRALDRAEQQRARFEPAEEVPVPLGHRVDREQVERAADHEPQHLRPVQREAAQAGAVDVLPEPAERAHDRIGAGLGDGVYGGHLSAP